MTPKPTEKPKSIYRRPSGICECCGGGVIGGKLVCEYCRQLDPDRAAHVERDERR